MPSFPIPRPPLLLIFMITTSGIPRARARRGVSSFSVPIPWSVISSVAVPIARVRSASLIPTSISGVISPSTRTPRSGFVASTFLFYLACDGSQSPLYDFFHFSICLCDLRGSIGFMMNVCHGFWDLSLAYFHFYFCSLSLLGLKLIRMKAFCDLVDESMILRLLHKGWLIEL